MTLVYTEFVIKHKKAVFYLIICFVFNMSQFQQALNLSCAVHIWEI